MRTKIIASLVAGGLLVGAGLMTTIVSSPGTAAAQEETAEANKDGVLHRGLAFLGEVLDDLVSEGKIEQADADVVLEAVQEEAEARKAEMKALRSQIHDFLSDGALTKAEFDQLPADNPFANERFDEAWADDQLTVEEIREIRPHPRRDAFKRGAHFGAMLDDGGIDQEEYDSLGDDHPLKQIDVSEHLGDDGVITIDELREIRQQFKADSPDA